LRLDIADDQIQTATVPPVQVRPPRDNFNNNRTLKDSLKRIKPYLESLSRPLRIFKINESIITGKEKYSGAAIKVLYLGETEKSRSLRLGKIYSKAEASGKYLNYQFILDTIYSDYEIVRQKKNISALNIQKRILRREKEVDLVITDVESCFFPYIKAFPYLVLPKWVWQKLTLAETWDAVLQTFSKGLRKELKSVLKHEYQYFVSQSNLHFKEFYNRMYLPYTKTRFADFATPMMSKAIQRGPSGDDGILFLLQNGSVLSGAFLRYYQDQMIGTLIAAADNVTSNMIKGAFTAMYYFSVKTAFEKGCRIVDFMGSRPLLKDGVFRYKRKWGTGIEECPFPANDFYFKICNFNHGVRNFFFNNPMIIKDKDKYVVKVLLTETATPADFKHCLKNYITKGLSRIEIFCAKGISKEAVEYASLNTPDFKVYDISNSVRPAYEFCRPQMKNSILSGT
jgi:hypothetical protein